ncbi:hypothetical protein [Bradyrhizobium sp.]|uniref:hypothetical protein n=1 Tax=Bradyrhizobium sp. TaxID=376 RepID=UPI0027328924|nr:hypothetical protein [Bradyrhizobium sp.]MDP3075894.1 hypothetical protein [Bradyrhizobium sp.]
MGKPAKKQAKKAAKKSAAPKPRGLFRAAHAAKAIAASRIYALFVSVLGRSIKDLADPPSDYGITNVIAYGDHLNHTDQFKPYHLDLQSNDMVNVQNMGDLGGAIVKNFQGNGWTVTAT